MICIYIGYALAKILLIKVSVNFLMFVLHTLCEKPLVKKDFNYTNLVTKVKVEHFHSQMKIHITKELLTAVLVALCLR